MKIGIVLGGVLLGLVVFVGGAAVAVANALFGSTSTADCGTVTGAASTVAGYTADQMANAATIVAVGKQMGIPSRGWIVAVAAALQESGLHNLDHGDRDSLGLFQERPSQGWGSPAQIMDTSYSSQQFDRHLTAISNRQQMSINDAAQAVERSAFPDAYGPHEQAATQIVETVQGVS